MSQVTYEWLFAYLKEHGFDDISPSAFERVFAHHELGILLAISMLDDAHETRVARAADVLSAEFQLHQHGLLNGRLVEVAGQRTREK